MSNAEPKNGPSLLDAGPRLQALRLVGEMSQTEVGNLLGIGQSTYSKYERSFNILPIEIAWKLAAIFKVSVSFLYDGYPVGMHPHIEAILMRQNPELFATSAIGMDQGKGMELQAYRAAIRRDLPWGN